MDPRSLRLYVLTSNTYVPGRGHADVATAAIAGGATAVQLRAPELDDARLCDLAAGIAARCRAADVLFVLNDRPAVAASIGVGAHVGQDDDPASARRAIGRDAVLGVSVSTPEEATAAERDGADYLGVTVWATGTKPEAVPHGLEGVRGIAAAARVPVVGIGGVSASNATEVLEAGAAGVAVISAVAAAADPVVAVRELRRAVDAFHLSERAGRHD
jgi:thiamine-phosphate diphosphorylase